MTFDMDSKSPDKPTAPPAEDAGDSRCSSFDCSDEDTDDDAPKSKTQQLGVTDTAIASRRHPFPATMNFYSHWDQFKTGDLCGTTEADRLYLVEVHTGYSGSGPLGTRPGLLLHNGMAKTDPILAAVGATSQWGARVASFTNESIILMPLVGHTEDFVQERMRASTGATKQVTFSFSVEVNHRVDGGRQEARRERFEWRKIEKGTDDTAREGGFKLVAAASSAANGNPSADMSGPSSSSAASSPSSPAATDNHGVLAFLIWGKSFSISKSKQILALELLGRGQSGELGERWTLMVVMTALRLWSLRLAGKTTKGLVAASEKVKGKLQE